MVLRGPRLSDKYLNKHLTIGLLKFWNFSHISLRQTKLWSKFGAFFSEFCLTWKFLSCSYLAVVKCVFLCKKNERAPTFPTCITIKEKTWKIWNFSLLGGIQKPSDIVLNRWPHVSKGLDQMNLEVPFSLSYSVFPSFVQKRTPTSSVAFLKENHVTVIRLNSLVL